jgi:hypothetical protein
MIDPAMHEILLPLRLHLVSCSRSGRPSGALPCKMASQTTLETSSTSTASLSWCTVQGWGIRVGASTSGSLDVGLESSVAVSETEGVALALASVAGSSGVA